MHWVEKPGTSLEAMRRITVNVSKELRSIPGVKNFGSHIGRAEVADEVVGPNFTELWISVDPKGDHAAIAGPDPGGRRRLSRACTRTCQTYLKERIKEVLTGAGATIVVRIFGPDMDVLRAKAQEIYKAMEGIDGDHQSEGRAAGPGAAARRPAAAGGRGTAGADGRRHPPGGDDADQGDEGRRALPGAEDLRRVRLGRPRRSATTCPSSARLPIETPAGDARAARRRGRRSRSCRRPTRSSAKGPRAGST